MAQQFLAINVLNKQFQASNHFMLVYGTYMIVLVLTRNSEDCDCDVADIIMIFIFI